MMVFPTGSKQNIWIIHHSVLSLGDKPAYEGSTSQEEVELFHITKIPQLLSTETILGFRVF